MPDTSVKHIQRKLRPWLLELPGEVFDAENCLQLLGALLQNRSEVFSGSGLCDVPRSNISHTEKEQVVVATPVLRLLVVRREFLSDMKISCWHLGRLCAWSRHVAITVTSVSYGGQDNSKQVI